MPIYEYACGSCEHQFETIQRASEEPLRDCPECGETALKKLLSAPVFRLKGSGWYETDFKTKDKRNVTDSGDGKEGGGQDANGKDSSTAEAGGKDGNSGKPQAEAAAGKASDGGSSKGASSDSGTKSTKPAKQD